MIGHLVKRHLMNPDKRQRVVSNKRKGWSTKAKTKVEWDTEWVQDILYSQHSSKQVGKFLHISASVVRYHRRKLNDYKKLRPYQLSLQF